MLTTADHVNDMASRATALHQKGTLEAAADLYQKIIELDPKNIIALGNLAQIRYKTGQRGEALSLYAEAYKQDPQSLPIMFNYANALRNDGMFEQAQGLYEQALKLKPAYSQARCGLGIVLKAQGLLGQAESELRQTVKEKPSMWRAWQELGEILNQKSCRKEADRAYSQGLLHNSVSYTLLTLQAHNALEMSDHKRSIALLKRAVEVAPERADVHNNLASSCVRVWELSVAEAAANRALELEPNYVSAFETLASVYTFQGKSEKAFQCLEKVSELISLQAAPAKQVNRAFSSLYLDSKTPEEVTAIQGQAIPALAGDAVIILPPIRPKEEGQLLRVGYLCPDVYGKHPVAQFIEPVLAAHNASKMSVHIFDNVEVSDATTARLQSLATKWHKVRNLDDPALATLIAEEKIDVLVDLAGHTKGSRVSVMRYRPAPVQMCFLGYPYTTGIQEVDYLIADRQVAPASEQALYSETLLYLPDCVFGLPQLEESWPCHRSKQNLNSVVFGSFGNLAKLSPTTVGLWCRVLNSVPNSSLVLKAGGLWDAGTRQYILQRFVDQGIAAERIDLRPPSHFDVMIVQYADVDVILDTVPYGSGTTCFHALWCGVPIVTLTGRTFYSRMSHSILTAIGKHEWSAPTEDDYVSICRGLADDIATVRNDRPQLRRAVQASPLADHAGYTAALEGLYEYAYQSAARH